MSHYLLNGSPRKWATGVNTLSLTKLIRRSSTCIGYYRTVLHQCVQQW